MHIYNWCNYHKLQYFFRKGRKFTKQHSTAKIKHEKKEAKAEYKKTIDKLEQKNSDKKKKLDDYKADGKEKWELFKTDFNKGMDEIGKSLKDLTAKNVK